MHSNINAYVNVLCIVHICIYFYGTAVKHQLAFRHGLVIPCTKLIWGP